MIRLRCSSTLLAIAALSCAARQAPALIGQPIRKPVALLVRVSDEAVKTDELGGTATLVETITSGLAERGVQTEIFAADDDHPPAPRIEVWVEKWDVGNRGQRAATRVTGDAATVATAGLPGGTLVAWAMAGRYDVVCRIYRDGETQPAFVERYRGRIAGTDAEASVDKGESVGEAIVADALGKPKPK